jgi:hypothetical protein
LDADMARFRAWQSSLAGDPDLGHDIRMMVPQAYDEKRRRTRVWLVAGWASRPVHIYFFEQPVAVIYNNQGTKMKEGIDAAVEFQEMHTRLVFPVTAEAYVERVLTREEFIRHCDTHRSLDAILEALQ